MTAAGYGGTAEDAEMVARPGTSRVQIRSTKARALAALEPSITAFLGVLGHFLTSLWGFR